MKNEELVEIAVMAVVCAIVVPAVINGGIAVVSTIGMVASEISDKIKYKKKIKKGLKDGSITKINGEYYEVEITDHVEEA